MSRQKSVIEMLASIARDVYDKQTCICSGGPDEGWKTVSSYRHDKIYTVREKGKAPYVKYEFVYIEW